MSRGNRDGKRKSREQRAKYKVPELGYYLIVTDTEATERCFFTGLHDSLDEKIKDRLIIRVVETKTRDMIDKCLEFIAYEAQYRMPWIVFDRDQVKDFDKIIDEAKEKGIDIGWSNPCFEIWMYAYFGITNTRDNALIKQKILYLIKSRISFILQRWLMMNLLHFLS